VHAPRAFFLVWCSLVGVADSTPTPNNTPCRQNSAGPDFFGRGVLVFFLNALAGYFALGVVFDLVRRGL
jgi:hypothetical protein